MKHKIDGKYKTNRNQIQDTTYLFQIIFFIKFHFEILFNFLVAY